MPVVSIVAALALQAAGPMAGGGEASVDPARREALVEYFGQVGSLAFHLGQCERFLPTGEGDRFVASVLRQEAYAGVPDFQAMLRSTFAALYAEGRVDPARLDLTADRCERLIKGAVKDVDAEGERVLKLLHKPAPGRAGP